eukprot:9443858-Pyramimonas_sp.AAC.2
MAVPHTIGLIHGYIPPPLTPIGPIQAAREERHRNLEERRAEARQQSRWKRDGVLVRPLSARHPLYTPSAPLGILGSEAYGRLDLADKSPLHP